MAGQRANWPEEAAAGEDDRQNFLLVHGGWHAAVHWNKVSEQRAAVGHRVCAIGLPGSGLNAACPQSYLRNHFTAFATEPSPIGGIHLADYARAITAQAARGGRRAEQPGRRPAGDPAGMMASLRSAAR